MPKHAIFTFYVLRFTFYVLHFAFCILHFTFYVLHFAFCILHFAFYAVLLNSSTRVRSLPPERATISISSSATSMASGEVL